MHRHLRQHKTLILLDPFGHPVIEISLSLHTILSFLCGIVILSAVAFTNEKYNAWGLQLLEPFGHTKMVNRLQKNAILGIEEELEVQKEKLLALQKDTAYIQNLFSIDHEHKNAFTTSEESRGSTVVGITKQLLGERIEKNSVRIGNRILVEFYEDNQKPATNNLAAEERALIAAKQLKQALSYRLLPGKVTIRDIGQGSFIGTLGRHTMFRVDENDVKYLNAPAEEVAANWARNINLELARIEADKKRLTMRRYIPLPFASQVTRLNKELNFLAQKTIEEEQVFASLCASAKQIQMDYAYTPSDYPISCPISSLYGLRRHPITHQLRFHSGVDFFAWPGTQIRATANGRVIYAGWHNGYGYTVMIYHGKGLTTLYAHNSRILVRSGSWVRKGQVVSLSGASGLASGAHLHYEVRQWNNPVNPVPYLNMNILTASQLEDN